ncbi:MAG: phosphoadenosine phosphosulfate reductase family protein [Acidobacteriota bacterium]|jgi:phosphoadenosine phosphosulfate reductase|nr:phosphoadenosine phosphosulfate reductase family protein [Acidobacteriota bacterium]
MRDLYGDMVQRAIDVIRTYSQGEPIHGAFSGGKDSVAIKGLCANAGIDVDWHYHVTTIDPPELVRFIKRHHPDVKFDIPKSPMLRLVPTHGFPTMIRRWCCAKYKEAKTNPGEVWLLGVRAAESPRRAKQWRQFMVRNNGMRAINPILYWRDEDVWTFIREMQLPYCELYDEGFKRLGCVGCPMGNQRRDFARWPHFERAWRKAFHELWATGRNSTTRWNSADEMFEWWIRNKTVPEKNDCQGLLELWA